MDIMGRIFIEWVMSWLAYTSSGVADIERNLL